MTPGMTSQRSWQRQIFCLPAAAAALLWLAVILILQALGSPTVVMLAVLAVVGAATGLVLKRLEERRSAD